MLSTLFAIFLVILGIEVVLLVAGTVSSILETILPVRYAAVMSGLGDKFQTAFMWGAIPLTIVIALLVVTVVFVLVPVLL